VLSYTKAVWVKNKNEKLRPNFWSAYIKIAIVRLKLTLGLVRNADTWTRVKVDKVIS